MLDGTGMSTAIVSSFFDVNDAFYKGSTMPSSPQFSKVVGWGSPLGRRSSNPVAGGLKHHNSHHHHHHNNNNVMCNNNSLGPPAPSAVAAHRKLDRCHSEPVHKNNGVEKPRGANINSSRYKTELCRPFEENGHCKYGEKCQFAHGIGEIRTLARHPKYKTELCRTFHTIGFCPYGPRCHFIHNAEEARPKPVPNSNNSCSRPRPLSLSSTPSPTSSLSESPTSLQSFFGAGEGDFYSPFSPTGGFFNVASSRLPPAPPQGNFNNYGGVAAMNARNELSHRVDPPTPPLIPLLDTPPSPVGSLGSDLDALTLSDHCPSRSLRLPVFSRLALDADR
ncbi:unnamed protein product [Darwinula stevensoni]|uniref:C3H1-type domain-containing protein n=1 Tax=Darwinula stevensoni TaxID=69355 RepID=A0A7R9A6C6_9CRUS|nr:unnamed protein product [Darwinula stevensoni]CAG0894092.1 unnamed protein product [Darwinula stevensoni]